MGRLNGKQAIVTGGASGIGRATARLFAQEGASVAILDIDRAGGQQIAEEITAQGGLATFIECDVTSSDQDQQAVKLAAQILGRIDILFNGAGIIRRATVEQLSEADWDRVLDVNLKSAYLMSKYVIPFMRQAGGGSIIHASSGWGLRGGPQAVAYCAAKGGLILLTRAMAIDHGAENIRVNCICPGDTDTPMLRHEARQLGQAEATFLAEAAERPLKRIAQPEEIAEAVLFLASEAASFVTGAALVVDGGGSA